MIVAMLVLAVVIDNKLDDVGVAHAIVSIGSGDEEELLHLRYCVGDCG